MVAGFENPANTNMKKGQSVSKKQVDAAAVAVQNELAAARFWDETSRLVEVDVFWCPIPQLPPDALGFFIHDAGPVSRLLGYEPGHIYIPQWVLTQTFWQDRGSLRDILRHEYGHALAHYYPKLIQRSADFRKAFGESYNGKRRAPFEDGEVVSDYATESPAEDFAETFMVFLRLRGKLPAGFRSPVLKRKWKFIGELAKALN